MNTITKTIVKQLVESNENLAILLEVLLLYMPDEPIPILAQALHGVFKKAGYKQLMTPEELEAEMNRDDEPTKEELDPLLAKLKPEERWLIE